MGTIVIFKSPHFSLQHDSECLPSLQKEAPEAIVATPRLHVTYAHGPSHILNEPPSFRNGGISQNNAHFLLALEKIS